MRQKNGKDVSCAVCGTDFYCNPSRLKNKTITCSLKCNTVLSRKKYRKGSEEKCEICQKNLYYKKNRHEKIKNYTCSVICRGSLIETLYKGNANPNKRHVFDTSLFEKIDSEEKAYILGLIASDGHVKRDGIVISLHKKDIILLEQVSEYVYGKKILKKIKNSHMVSFGIYSVEAAADIARHLKIPFGKKAFTVKYPDIPKELDRHFIRGIFDGDGCVISICDKSPCGAIGMSSISMIEDIKNKSEIKPNGPYFSKKMAVLEWIGNNALDFFDWIYKDSKIRMARKHDLFLDWSVWVAGINSPKGWQPNNMAVRWVRTSKESQAPYKSRASDSGYDLTLIKKMDEIYPGVTMYDTGIKIQSAYGWWFMLVGRSSISKSGYQIVNCLGVLDRNYVGTIKVALKKINENVPELQLPARIVQIIPMPAVHFELEEVQDFEQTSRGDKGFGSSGV